MGMYDTVWFKNNIREDVGIQFKVGENLLIDYQVGSDIPLLDGIYFGHEGCFVVKQNKVVACFDSTETFMFNKWGGVIKYPDL